MSLVTSPEGIELIDSRGTDLTDHSTLLPPRLKEQKEILVGAPTPFSRFSLKHKTTNVTLACLCIVSLNYENASQYDRLLQSR